MISNQETSAFDQLKSMGGVELNSYEVLIDHPLVVVKLGLQLIYLNPTAAELLGDDLKAAVEHVRSKGA